MKYVQPFDQPSNPTAAYVDLNAATGTDGSVPPAKFFNDVQAEILNVITGASLTPNGSDPTQLRQAILAMIPTPTGAPSDASLRHYGSSDAGSANAPRFTPTPSTSSVAAGFEIDFIPGISAADGSATISIVLADASIVTRPLTRSDGSSLSALDYIAGRVSTAVFDGTQFRLKNPGVPLVRMFTSSGSFTPRAGSRFCFAIGVGGGGAGGSSNGASSLVGTGGESGCSVLSVFSTVGLGTQSLVIGPGGTPSASNAAANSQAGSGSQTSLGSLLVAPGGKGGWNSYGVGSQPAPTSIASAVGFLKIPGNPGQSRQGDSFNYYGGSGGASLFGGAGPGGDGQSPGGLGYQAGYDATGFGSGGGGGDSGSNTPVQGGAGAAGVIITIEI